MTKKRDVLQEIREKRIRGGVYKQLTYRFRFNNIDELFKRIARDMKTADEEMLRCIPFASIAVTESHFRICYALIIDHNDVHFANAIKLLKEHNLKFDLDFLVPMQGKKLTAGEIFSHLL